MERFVGTVSRASEHLLSGKGRLGTDRCRRRSERFKAQILRLTTMTLLPLRKPSWRGHRKLRPY